MTRAEAIANDPRVTVAARIAMFLTPIIVLAGLTIGGWVISGQAAQRTVLENRVSNMETFAATANSRISVLESTSSANKANRDAQISAINARIDSNQNAVETKLDKLTDLVTGLSNNVAGLTATIKAREGFQP